MGDTSFVANSTRIVSTWLQKINDKVFKGRDALYVTSTGTATAYVITLPPTSLYSALAAGDEFTWKAHATNTGAATLQVVGASSLTAKDLYLGGSAVSAGQIQLGDINTVRYDGTQFQIVAGTALARFIQSGTGAVSRTMQDKGRDIIHRDDFSTLQQAIDAVPAGGILYGDGTTTEVVSTAVTISAGIRITGLKLKPAVNLVMFTISANDVEIDHCYFDLSSQNGGTHTTNRAIYAVDRSRLRIHHNTFQDGAIGAYFDNCTDVWFDDNYCDNATGWHNFFYGGTDIKIRGNTCTNGTFDGIKLGGEDTSTGVTRTLKNVEVTNNYCSLNDRDGIDFATNDCDNVLIAGNVLVNNKLNCMEIKTLAHADTSLDYSMRHVLITDNVCRNGSYTDTGNVMITVASGAGDFTATTAGKQLFRDVRITNNKIHIEAVSTNNYFAIRTTEVVSALIDGNHITSAATTGGSLGLIRAHYGTSTVIRGNIVDGTGVTGTCGISVSSLGTANATSGVVITKNRVISGASTNPIRIPDAAVSGTVVYDNELFPDGTNGANQYGIADSGTGTVYRHNYRGSITGNPNVRGHPGDYFIESSIGDGYPEKWVAMTHNSPAVWAAVNTKPSINSTAVGNVTTGEDDLMTFSLPANTMRSTGAGIRIVAWGTKANNANAKTLKLYFGTTAIMTTSLGTSAAGNWRITAEVLRTGASTQDWNSAMVGTDTDIEKGTATETETSAITIKCTGDATATNDIVQEGLIVEVLR